jgi:hypothetical protein
MKDR